MKNLVVVVDMVKGFLVHGNLADKNINRIVDNVVSLIKAALESEATVVGFKDTHDLDDEELKYYLIHCLRGTDECEYVPKIKPYEGEMINIEKNTTDGFVTPEFMKLIKNTKFDNIIVCGCCTDICVKEFINSLNMYLREYSIETNIIVASDAVDTFGGDGRNPDEINKECLKMFEDEYNAITCTTDSIISSILTKGVNV